jgi:hypothetical protein
MDGRVQALIAGLPDFVGTFEASGRFTSPSVHFHNRVIGLRRHLGSALSAIESDDFVELLYATLTAWGMHRMGPGNTKLREFEEFAKSLRRQRDAIAALDGLSLSQLSSLELEAATNQAWQVIEALNVSIAEARIVANSKTLHHLAPDLIPPIDRSYTYRFFYGRMMLSIPEKEAFREMFARFHMISTRASGSISTLLGAGWNTSVTKVMDNALVGYVIQSSPVVAE